MKPKWPTKKEVLCYEGLRVLSIKLEVSPALEAEEKYIEISGIKQTWV